MALLDQPGAWLVRFLSEEVAHGRPIGESAVDQLARLWPELGQGLRGAIVRGLQEVITLAIEEAYATPVSVVRALALVSSLGLKELIPSLVDVVHARSLARRIDSYDDLHGRALVVLAELGGLDLTAQWQTERSHVEYTPLMFALIREYQPDAVARLLADAIPLGFVRDAVLSVASEWPEDQAERAFLAAAGIVRSLDALSRSEFFDAIDASPLRSVVRFRIARAVGLFAGSPNCIVVGRERWGEGVVQRLRATGIAVSTGERTDLSGPSARSNLIAIGFARELLQATAGAIEGTNRPAIVGVVTPSNPVELTDPVMAGVRLVAIDDDMVRDNDHADSITSAVVELCLAVTRSLAERVDELQEAGLDASFRGLWRDPAPRLEPEYKSFVHSG